MVSDDLGVDRLEDKHLMAKFRGNELVKKVVNEGVVKELITLEETYVESATDESAPDESASEGEVKPRGYVCTHSRGGEGEE